MVNAALPNRAYNVLADDYAKSKDIKNFAAQAGLGRWDAATQLADIKDLDVLFDYNGDLVIRRAISDDSDDVSPGVGPDIGTVANPIATITEGIHGSLVALTATVTREGGCNGVQINLQPAVTRAGKAIKDSERHPVSVVVQQEGGPAKWGDVFGFLPIVESHDVHKATAEVVANYRGEARKLLQRRRGVIRYLDADAVGCYWVEPDDKIRFTFGSPAVTEDHYVAAVTFDVTGKSPARLRTRQLAVLDPG
jgi:hypothetical protein